MKVLSAAKYGGVKVFHRGAGAPSVKVSIVAERREGREGRWRESVHRGAGCVTYFAQDAAQDAA